MVMGVWYLIWFSGILVWWLWDTRDWYEEIQRKRAFNQALDDMSEILTDLRQGLDPILVCVEPPDRITDKRDFLRRVGVARPLRDLLRRFLDRPDA
jgi:hypothetical protein